VLWPQRGLGSDQLAFIPRRAGKVLQLASLSGMVVLLGLLRTGSMRGSTSRRIESMSSKADLTFREARRYTAIGSVGDNTASFLISTVNDISLLLVEL
jgi:hypothetical protein